jgi:DNA primase
MQDAKEEVRSRLNIEDVIGEYVQLKRAGRNFKGLSPFSGEKSPSFFVSPDKHIWHDFSSNKGGDVFSFVMEVEGLDFREALEQLARKAGVDLSMYETKGTQDLARRKKRLLEVNNLAASYYQHSLLKNPRAVEYVFKARRLSKEIVTNFRIGYAADNGDGLLQFLTKKGFSKKEISEAGLSNRYGGDLFRGRMMVPLMDSTGQVIGFTARVIDSMDKNAPKYLNTPQTLLYDKSRHVFGLSQAKEAIRINDYSVIVEGNLDVISSHQVNVNQVVATAGTAMTEYHLRALKRLSGNVRLAFDGDKAGVAATERAIPIARSVGVELSIITLPGDAKDPDELIQKDVLLWERAIQTAEPAIDWILSRYSEREDITTAQGKRAFSTASLDLIRHLPDPIEKEHYARKIAEMIGASENSVKAKLESIDITTPAPLKRPAKAIEQREISQEHVIQDNLLAVGISDGESQKLFINVDNSIFEGEERQAVARYLAIRNGKKIEETPKDLQKYDTYVKILLLKADARYADWSAQDRSQETARLLRQVITEYKKKQKENLRIELRDAEMNHDETRALELLQKITQLNKEITHA